MVATAMEADVADAETRTGATGTQAVDRACALVSLVVRAGGPRRHGRLRRRLVVRSACGPPRPMAGDGATGPALPRAAAGRDRGDLPPRRTAWGTRGARRPGRLDVPPRHPRLDAAGGSRTLQLLGEGPLRLRPPADARRTASGAPDRPQRGRSDRPRP